MADAEPPIPAKSSSWHLPLWLALIFVVYALSPGPVIMFFGTRTRTGINALYAPLIFLNRQLPPVQAFYDWYLPLWGVTDY